MWDEVKKGGAFNGGREEIIIEKKANRKIHQIKNYKNSGVRERYIETILNFINLN